MKAEISSETLATAYSTILYHNTEDHNVKKSAKLIGSWLI